MDKLGKMLTQETIGNLFALYLPEHHNLGGAITLFDRILGALNEANFLFFAVSCKAMLLA